MNGTIGLTAQRGLVRYHASPSRLLFSRPQQLVQVRNFPWVPFAYRRGARKAAAATKSRPRPRTRTGPNSLRSRTPPRPRRCNQNVGPDATSGKKRRAGSSFEMNSLKDTFLEMQKSLEQHLNKYKESLNKCISSKSQDKSTVQREPYGGKQEKNKAAKSQSIFGSSNQITALISQLADAHDNASPKSWEEVEDTEQAFRDLCKVIDTMIFHSAKIQTLTLSHEEGKTSEAGQYFYSSLAEQLLLSWIALRSDRLHYVEAAASTLRRDSEDMNLSWFSWLKEKVMNGSAQKGEVAESESKPPMAHEDPLCGPRLEHLHEVSTVILKNLRDELKHRSQSPFRKIRRAQGLQQLFDKLPDYVVPDSFAVQTLMNTFALVGSYESARACEMIVEEKYPEFQDDLFDVVLYAYALAAKSSPRNQDRSKAAARADEIVRQRWNNSGTPEQYEEKKFIHCTKSMLCLHAIGTEAIPDVCKRAEVLVDMCIGKDNLDEVFRKGDLTDLWKIAPPHLTLPMLNCLVLIYSSSGDPSRVNLSKHLLKILLKDSDFKTNSDVPFPDLRSCKAVLAGLVGINDRKIRLSRNVHDKTSNETGQQDSLQENLNYGIELLDLMYARTQCWPDQSFFHSLLRLLLLANPKGAGAIAEHLLSKMHVRECFEFSGDAVVTKKTYHNVLRAWLRSAESRDPSAATRALEILDMMEAQSLPLLTSLTNSSGSHIYKSAVAPDRSTYQLVLKICSSIKVVSEKEEALDIALACSKRMQQRGISPSSDTYSLLFACCSNLLPEHSKRRQKVTQQLLEEARDQGNVNEGLLNRIKGGSQKTSASDDDEGTAKPVGGSGLLSDLN